MDWISVSESLPDEDLGWVLLWINYHQPPSWGGISEGGHEGCYDSYEKKWRTRFAPLRDGWEVTHWQPFPDGPNSGD